MTQRLLAATLSLAGLVLAAPGAGAQGLRCGDRADIVAHLASAWGETRQAAGLGADDRMVEIFASGATGTWTILLTLPSGKSCLLASGEAWTGPLPPPAGGDPA